VIRFTGANVDFDAPDGNTVAVDTGGLQAGTGLRLRFFDRRQAGLVRAA
jgi:hypothetical protein